MKKNFLTTQKVKFVNLPEDCEILNQTGIILGKAHVHITDTYIVMLDIPYKDSLAINMTEACLEKVGEENIS